MKLKTSGAWALVLTDAFGNPLAQALGSAVLKWTRNSWAEATVTLDLDEPSAALLMGVLAQTPLPVGSGSTGGLPMLFAMRDNTPRFAGAFWSAEEDGGETEGVAKLTFRDPLGHIMEAPTLSDLAFTSTQGSGIAGLLLSNLAGSGMAHRFATPAPSGAAGASVSRAYPPGSPVGRGIVDLTETAGFDIETGPVWNDDVNAYPGMDRALGDGSAWPNQTPELGYLTARTRLGSDKSASVIFEYGGDGLANVRRCRRVTVGPRTSAVGLGADGLTVLQRNLSAQTVYGGSHSAYSFPQATDTAGLAGLTASELRSRPISVVEITPDPDIAPQPWVDYWLGDNVAVRAQRGSMIFDAAPRINSVEVTLDVDGLESAHVVTLDQGVT